MDTLRGLFPARNTPILRPCARSPALTAVGDGTEAQQAQRAGAHDARLAADIQVTPAAGCRAGRTGGAYTQPTTASCMHIGSQEIVWQQHSLRKQAGCCSGAAGGSLCEAGRRHIAACLLQQLVDRHKLGVPCALQQGAGLGSVRNSREKKSSSQCQAATPAFSGTQQCASRCGWRWCGCSRWRRWRHHAPPRSPRASPPRLVRGRPAV